ncbi:hypothetical protein [[Phormidium] sp. ETS-05]|uniref:hypothetical protein n=1 Tax=[Phormidium] sp. ETS-05 TaxID=222819 RepID=UPI0018EF1C24|nr:hypothetical protein [[Phormidium] sp. ETS-05]
MLNLRPPKFLAVALSLLIAAASWFYAPSALALTEIKLFDLAYNNCPPELAEGAVTSGGNSLAANCFIITGKAENPSNKTVYDADIFGRIYDANNNNILPNRTRLGNIEVVPPGVSNFELRISVAANLPTPLSLKNFKARGFAGNVSPLFPE